MTVEKRSDVVQEMLTAAQPVLDITRGGEHMRDCGTKYLPQFPMEDNEAYKARRESTWLFDGVGKTIQDMAGKVFDVPVTLGETNTELDEWVVDIDLEGRDLSRFARDVFVQAQRTGISFVMADAPRRDGDVTRAQAKAMRLRPYLTMLTLEEVLGWKWAYIDNAPTITQFRIMETVNIPDGEFGEKSVPQVRVLDLPNENGMATGAVTVRLFQKPDGKDYTQVDEYTTGMSRIMVAPCDIGRTGFFKAVPVHAGLAELNLAHWRIQSDKASCLHKALAPLLFMKGLDITPENSPATSAGFGFLASAEHADLKWIEITGNGIEAARSELKDIELQMQAMGLQIVMPRTGSSTATGDAIDESKANSLLASWADVLKDCLELALGWVAELGGIQADIEVAVNKDYAASALSHVDMAALQAMFMAEVISRETYINEAKRRGILAEGVTPEDEAERIGAMG